MDAVDGTTAVPRPDDASGEDGLGGLGDLLGGATGGLTTEGLDAQVTETISNVLGDLGDYTSERRDEELPVAATEVLEDYRAEGVDLVYADYLGVLEDTWACLVKGDRWVEVCIVREDEVDGTSKVETIHFDADRFAEELPPDFFDEDALERLDADLEALNLGGDADEASTGEGAAR